MDAPEQWCEPESNSLLLGTATAALFLGAAATGIHLRLRGIYNLANGDRGIGDGQEANNPGDQMDFADQIIAQQPANQIDNLVNQRAAADLLNDLIRTPLENPLNLTNVAVNFGEPAERISSSRNWPPGLTVSIDRTLGRRLMAPVTLIDPAFGQMDMTRPWLDAIRAHGTQQGQPERPRPESESPDEAFTLGSYMGHEDEANGANRLDRLDVDRSDAFWVGYGAGYENAEGLRNQISRGFRMEPADQIPDPMVAANQTDPLRVQMDMTRPWLDAIRERGTQEGQPERPHPELEPRKDAYTLGSNMGYEDGARETLRLDELLDGLKVDWSDVFWSGYRQGYESAEGFR
jgi:hypothetical protein